MTMGDGFAQGVATARQLHAPAAPGEVAQEAPARATGSRSEAGHPRHRRIPTIIESACEDPSALVGLLGEERIAALTGFPEAAISNLVHSRADLQRRFAARLRQRLGLSRRQVAAARRIPGDPALVTRAIRFFATTMRLADTPRVVSRETMRRNAELYGEEALAFALVQKPLLGQSIEALREFITEPPISDADKRMFVRALAAHGHDGAPALALLLDLPVETATRGFSDRFDAVITGLPTLAARALTRVMEDTADERGTGKGTGTQSGPAGRELSTSAGDHSVMPSPDEVRAAEAQWRADGVADGENEDGDQDGDGPAATAGKSAADAGGGGESTGRQDVAGPGGGGGNEPAP